MEGCNCASLIGRDCSTIETCLGIYVSFESVSHACSESFGGAERVPRECERHAKERDSFEAGDAPLYVWQQDGSGCVEHSRKGARRPSVPCPKSGCDSGATACGPLQRFSERLKHLHDSQKAPYRRFV
jgi:hypothetical protein